MQTSPAKRRPVVFLTVALLLTIVLGYQWYRDTRTVVRSPRPAPMVTPNTTTVAIPDDTVAMPVAPTPPPVPTVSKKRPSTDLRTSANEPDPQPEPPKEPTPEPAKPPACDQLVFRDGDLIDAHILEVGVNEIRYKRCGRKDGPDYVVLRREVLSIRYPNGEVDRLTP